MTQSALAQKRNLGSVGGQHVRADTLIFVIQGIAVDIYKNGVLVEDTERKVTTLEGNTSIEHVEVPTYAGDWLVFHLANRGSNTNSKYFALAGVKKSGEITYVSEADSSDWSSCDYPSLASKFITEKEFGRQSRVACIPNYWTQGDRVLSGQIKQPFAGQPIWGTASSTWIKYRVPNKAKPIRPMETPKPVVPITGSITVETKPINPAKRYLAVISPDKWPIQILSARIGAGVGSVDVSGVVKDYVEVKRVPFSVNKGDIEFDASPDWKQGLQVSFMKNGVLRTLIRGENERLYPESFYGPQDVSEMEQWLVGKRWRGYKGDIQFYPNSIVLGSTLGGQGTWRVTASNKVEITWPKVNSSTVFVCNSTWSKMSNPDYDKQSFQILGQPSSVSTITVDSEEVQKLLFLNMGF